MNLPQLKGKYNCKTFLKKLTDKFSKIRGITCRTNRAQPFTDLFFSLGCFVLNPVHGWQRTKGCSWRAWGQDCYPKAQSQAGGAGQQEYVVCNRDKCKALHLGRADSLQQHGLGPACCLAGEQLCQKASAAQQVQWEPASCAVLRRA